MAWPGPPNPLVGGRALPVRDPTCAHLVPSTIRHCKHTPKHSPNHVSICVMPHLLRNRGISAVALSSLTALFIAWYLYPWKATWGPTTIPGVAFSLTPNYGYSHPEIMMDATVTN